MIKMGGVLSDIFKWFFEPTDFMPKGQYRYYKDKDRHIEEWIPKGQVQGTDNSKEIAELREEIRQLKQQLAFERKKQIAYKR